MNEARACEITIQILDEFEESLAAKGIKVPSEDREGRDEEACLYGSEYYESEDEVTDLLIEEVGGSPVVDHDCVENRNTSGCATRK